jgi:hypothetical protein
MTTSRWTDINLGSDIVDAYEIDEDGVVALDIRADATLWFSFTGAEWWNLGRVGEARRRRRG